MNGYYIIIIVVNPGLGAMLERNWRRDRVVPDRVIARQYASLVYPLPWEAHEIITIRNGEIRR